MRTFIAVDLPETVRDSLRELQAGLRGRSDGVKWVRVEGMHLTLKFLGEIDPDLVSGIDRVLQEAARSIKPFRIALSGLGAFPGLSRPRVIWVGVDGELEPLQNLKSGIDKGLAELGFPKDDRSFKPHITLGRVKGKIDGRRLVGDKNYTTDHFLICRVRLIESILKPTGAEYSEVLSRPLTAGD
ncbi:RNA 2',3'-cyclic phosphodiesterase [candidate division KSB1 bacterium]